MCKLITFINVRNKNLLKTFLQTSTKEISLEVNDDRLTLECKKRGYYFDGFVNTTIDPNRCTSHFDLETKVSQYI